jgi:HK97 family phage portal protein
MSEKLEKFTSVNGSGKIIPMPLGMEAKMLDMKLADPQFFAHNKINNLQLAAAFGIKPNVINDYDKSSYSNSETQQLDFYVNTLQPLFKSYEQELTTKLLNPDQIRKGVRLEIDEKILFKMDSKTQSEVLTKYVAGGILTPNEARVTLDYQHDENGNILMINGGAVPLDQVKKLGVSKE